MNTVPRLRDNACSRNLVPTVLTIPVFDQSNQRSWVNVAGGTPLPAHGAAEARRQDLHGEKAFAHAGGPRH